MSQELWTKVDHYLEQHLIPEDPVLAAAIADSEASGLPSIAVSPAQGKFLNLLARIQGARKILEIGTLGGYSTIWLGRALPAGGRLVTMEADPKHAAVAAANIARAGLADMVDVRVGKALETLPHVETEGLGPFDLFFIDADKQSIPDYFLWSLKLARVGSVIIVDNVVRKGAVADSGSEDAMVRGVQRFNELVAREERVTATAIQTVGVKGYDGFAVVLVTKV